MVKSIKALIVPLLLASLVAPTMPAAAADQAGEDAVKAAFLLNFTKFVEWPDGAQPWIIVIVGDSPVEARLVEALRGRPSHIQVAHVQTAEEVITRAHIVFIEIGRAHV